MFVIYLIEKLFTKKQDPEDEVHAQLQQTTTMMYIWASMILFLGIEIFNEELLD